MPHITLEYSANLAPHLRPQELFPALHEKIVRLAGAALVNCKSRAIRLEDFRMGDGGAENAFVHLAIRILEGRTPEVKQAIGSECVELLRAHLGEIPDLRGLQLSVEILDIVRAQYFKHP